MLLGERVTGAAVDLVTVDNGEVAAAAVEHLVGLGRRRLAALGVQATAAAETARLRLTGFRQALERADLPVDPSLELSVRHWHRADGAQAARALLAVGPLPDAVVCFNDLLALGLLRGLAEAGVRVPDDIAVIGIDDVEDGRYVRPSLSTVALDKRQIADAAVELLAARVAGRRRARLVRSPPATGSSSGSPRPGSRSRPRARHGSGRSAARRAAPAAEPRARSRHRPAPLAPGIRRRQGRSRRPRHGYRVQRVRGAARLAR